MSNPQVKSQFTPRWVVSGPQTSLPGPVRSFLGISLLALSGACGAQQPVPPCAQRPLAVRLVASEQINASSTGQSLPTRLAIVQLDHVEPARSISFESFWQGAEPEPALLSRETFTVLPGARLERSIPRAQGARFVMAAALFRVPDANLWREFLVIENLVGSCHALPPQGKEVLEFHLEGYRIEAPDWSAGGARADGAPHFRGRVGGQL